MTTTFKSAIPYNNFLLLIYGACLKWPLFIHPHVTVINQEDSFLSKILFSELQLIIGNYPLVYSLIILFITYFQAIALNQIVNNQKLFPKPNYLTGMSYMLLTSLFSSWYVLSPMMLAMTLLVPIISILTNISLIHDARKTLFNAGLLLGLSLLIYFPSVIYILVILLAVAITRPFRLPEWLLIFIGLITPYYFFWSVGFLSGSFENNIVTITGVQKKYNLPSSFEFVSIGIVLITALIGFILIQGNMRRMLVQSRKAWSIIYLFFIVSTLIPFLNEQPGVTYCIPLVISLSVIVSGAYFYPVKQWFPRFSHWSLIAFSAITGYYFIFHK